MLGEDDFVMDARLVKVTTGLVVAALRRHIHVQAATSAMWLASNSRHIPGQWRTEGGEVGRPRL